MNPFLILTRIRLTGVGLAMVAFFLGNLVFGQEESPQKESEVIKVLTFHDPQSQALFEITRKFEDTTGILVEMTQLHRSEMLNELNLTDYLSQFDLVTVDEPFLALMSDVLLPFDDWPSPQKFDPIQLEGWTNEQMIEASSIDGVLYGVPVNPNVYLYVYRKDLWDSPKEQQAFEERYGYELAPPRDAQQFRDMAEFFHRPPDLYGFSPVDQVSEALTIALIWSLELFGQTLSDDELQTNFDKEAAEDALEWYRSLSAFGPKKRGAWHYDQRADLMRVGKLAQGMLWPAYIPNIMDPKETFVQDDLGFSVGPRAPDGSPVCISGMWTMGIPRRSEKADLAVEFAAFWSEPETNLLLVRRGASPTRTISLDHQKIAAALPWLDAYEEAIQDTISRAQNRGYPAFSEAAAEIFAAYLSGKESASEAVEELLQLGTEETE
ncbi:extracellular solute-binding protein [Puniceicoccus vermicola]|uniref:Extracellular solute-binding protein n=1 Tax=Puniceicoccus vermicola TaxID=388746 RepID=A0A7X1AVL3_9BACT|nr:extracellular solute-binding protein [Puniceicoccus vermicola]